MDCISFVVTVRLVWKHHKMYVPTIGPTVMGNVEVRVDYFVRVGMYEEYGSEIHIDLPVVIGTVGTKGNLVLRIMKNLNTRKQRSFSYV